MAPMHEPVLVSGILGAATDGVSERYGAAARGGSNPSEQQAAAVLLAAASQLSDEEDAAALKSALEAKAKFQAAGAEEGVVDAVRLAVHVLVYQDKRKEADAMARDELARIRATRSRVGEAKMMLSVAEVNSEGRGDRHREETATWASQAAEMFRAEGDRRFEIIASLAGMSSQLRRRDDEKRGAAEALRIAKEACDVFRQLGHPACEAVALHCSALARVRCAAVGAECDDVSPGAWLAAASSAAQLFQGAQLRKLEAFERICIAMWLTAENPRKALRSAEDAQAFCRDIGAVRAEAAALLAAVKAQLAIKDISHAWMRKEAGEAVRKAKAGVARFRGLGDKAAELPALTALLLAYAAREDVREASAIAESALKVAQSLEDRASESAILQFQSGLCIKQGQYDKALRAARQLNAVSHSLHERAVALETTFEVHMLQGDFRKAKSATEELLALCEEEGCKKREGMTRLLISSIHQAEGDYSESIAIAREAQALLNDVGAVKEEASALRMIAEVQVASGEHDAALRAADKSRRLAASTGCVELECALLLLIAQVRFMQFTARVEGGLSSGSPAFSTALGDAALAADEAVYAARRLGDTRLEAAGLCTVAQVQMAGFKTEVAQRAADEALALFQELADDRNQAYVMCIQADLQFVDGNTHRALQSVEKALKLYQDVNDDRGVAMARSLREHIAGPEEVEEEEAPTDGHFTEEQWRQWEEYQLQQQKGAGAAAPPTQLAALKKKREPVALGAKLDMAHLRAEDVQRRVEEIVRNSVDIDDDEDVPLDMPLMQLGVTSKAAVEVRNAISEQLPGIPLPFTMVFDYPSVNSMTEMIMQGGGN